MMPQKNREESMPSLELSRLLSLVTCRHGVRLSAGR